MSASAAVVSAASLRVVPLRRSLLPAGLLLRSAALLSVLPPIPSGLPALLWAEDGYPAPERPPAFWASLSSGHSISAAAGAAAAEEEEQQQLTI